MTTRVCLLSPAPVWVNPRLVKEADTLHAAGYDVVVGYRADGDVERDDAILATKPWRWHRIDVARARRPVARILAAWRQRGAEWLVRAGVPTSAVARAAYCRSDGDLADWAMAQDADLYIAHTQPVLAVAADAARSRRVPFAFDCEDLLAEEAADGGRAAWRRGMIRRLERQYLPQAAYVSATSAPMAAYLVERYALRTVPVWHNCIPAVNAAALHDPGERPAAAGPVELAWISATIGPGRGLEDIFAALPQVGSRVVLHLYGAVTSGHAEWLEVHLAPLRARSLVVVHPVQPPDRVLVALAQHRIGLSLDPDDCLNRGLTVSNKFFLYLQAGLACVATDTAACTGRAMSRRSSRSWTGSRRRLLCRRPRRRHGSPGAHDSCGSASSQCSSTPSRAHSRHRRPPPHRHQSPSAGAGIADGRAPMHYRGTLLSPLRHATRAPGAALCAASSDVWVDADRRDRGSARP